MISTQHAHLNSSTTTCSSRLRFTHATGTSASRALRRRASSTGLVPSVGRPRLDSSSRSSLAVNIPHGGLNLIRVSLTISNLLDSLENLVSAGSICYILAKEGNFTRKYFNHSRCVELRCPSERLMLYLTPSSATSTPFDELGNARRWRICAQLRQRSCLRACKES